jgi:hypothetical protein
MYNINYFELMLRQNSGTAEQINKIRWDFVGEVNPKIVLDYGSGVGWFRAWRPKDIEVDTYDTGNFVKTGILHKKYDLVTMWDVLEHIPNLDEVLSGVCESTKYLALAVPIKPEDVKLEEWKHYKPGEHLHQFTEESLSNLLKEYGFIQVKKGQPECPPRKDIWNFLYKKSDIAPDPISWGHTHSYATSGRP